MGPKKRSRQAAKKRSTSKTAGAKKRKVQGLLGLQGGYNSESDDDYEPQARRSEKPSPAKARGKGTAKGRRTSSPTPSTSSESDSSDIDSRDMECSYTSSESSDSSGSEETLAARQQRRLSTTPAQPAKGRGGGRRARASDPPAVITTWDQLPTAVLAQIFLSVCKHGALPMAPRLACVCTSFNAAVAATPELWRLVDTAAIPNRSWVQAAGGTRSPPGKSKGAAAARGKQKQPAGGRKGASTQLSAEQGLSQWITSGRLQQLQTLLLYGEGAAGAGCADPQEAAGGDANRQLSAPLLMQIADSCQQLRRVNLFGACSLRPEEVSSALLSMPALSELWLCGVRFSALTGLTSCLCSVLEAAAVSGYPRLTELVVDGCNSLGQKAVSALCPVLDASQPAGPGQQAGAAAAGDAQLAEPASPAAAPAGEGSSGAVPAAQPRGPAFPHLEVLDVSHSAGLMGRPFKLLLDEMQAAMPNLRVLKLTGLGGLYGWQVGVRDPALLPGFPALESLHVGCALSAPLSGKMALHAGTSYVNNTVLLQLAGKSPKLHALDLSGCLVNQDGLRELAAAHAACRPATDASTADLAGRDGVDGDADVEDDAGPAAGSDSGTGSAGHGTAARGGTLADALGPEELAELQHCINVVATSGGALHLRDLQLDGSALATDYGLIAVANCCCDTLEQLVVRNAGARLGDEGISSLCRCKKLSTLDITGCSVTEEGLSALLSELPAGMLEELHLESCRSLSRGARQAAARGVQQLQEYLANRDN